MDRTVEADGRRRRKRAVAAVVVGVLAGCSGTSANSAGPTDSPDVVSTPAATSDSPRAVSGDARALPAAQETCLVEMPDEWLELMPSTEPLTEPVDRLAQLVTDEGGVAYFAGIDGRGVPRLEWTAPGSDQVVVVASFPDQPEAQAMSLDFDGRYLVYAMTWSYSMFDSPWTIYVWDSQSGGDPIEIAESLDGNYPDGSAGSMPLIAVHAYEGVAAWVARDPTSEEPFSRSLFAYAIANETTEVLARDEFRSGTLSENTVIVPVKTPRSEDVTWQVHPLNEQPAITLPDEFTESRTAIYVAASSAGIIWNEGINTEEMGEDGDHWKEGKLWFWPKGADASILLLEETLPGGGPGRAADALTMNDRFLSLRLETTTVGIRSHVYDLKSESWTAIREGLPDGEFTAQPGALQFHYYSNNDGTGGSPYVVIPNQDLPPLPACTQ